METNSEGEVRLQRAMLSQALQVCPLFIPKYLLDTFSPLVVLAAVNISSQLLFTDQESLDELMVKKRWYGGRDDFTVIVQDSPFIADLSSVAVSPTTPES